MIHLVVLGDIHANLFALEAALAQAVRGPMDQLIFLGDLLSYGVHVRGTLDAVAAAQARHGAVLLTGNHDQLYTDLGRGDDAYLARLPDWIRETVDATRRALDPAAFAALRWSDEHVVDGALFSHANPFGGRDWTYLNLPPELARAAAALTARGLSLGVFGHTHRPRWGPGELAVGQPVTLPRSAAAPIVANAGSVGQPRDQHARSYLLRLALTATEATATFEPVDYDVAAHLAALRASGLSDATVERLASYFLKA